ncbi:flagellar basal body-associated protein FliL [Anaerobacillus sp. MEB173]|uniref:flagellar basal body-associated protein FliL n=1 Tax=Anaerobacillus sp. MEB173 TaxID=3383345 RepID=UPI003F8FDE5F
MFKNKLVKIMLIILIALTLIGVTALVVINYFSSTSDEPKELTIEEVIELSVDTQEITTNLLSNDYIRIKFKIQTDNKKAKVELEKRDFQVNNIIIRELSGMESTDFEGPEGLQQLEDNLKVMINEILQNGKVVQVYTTSIIVQ